MVGLTFIPCGISNKSILHVWVMSSLLSSPIFSSVFWQYFSIIFTKWLLANNSRCHSHQHLSRLPKSSVTIDWYKTWIIWRHGINSIYLRSLLFSWSSKLWTSHPCESDGSHSMQGRAFPGPGRLLIIFGPDSLEEKLSLISHLASSSSLYHPLSLSKCPALTLCCAGYQQLVSLSIIVPVVC